MENKRDRRTALVAIIGSIVLAVILIGGTVWMGQSAQKDTMSAVRSVSLLYLDELAGRREQVVEDELKDNIRMINMAISLMKETDLSKQESLEDFLLQMRRFFNLEWFALVDEQGRIYTSEGIKTGIEEYDFDYRKLSGSEIFVRDGEGSKKYVVIAVPVEDVTLNGAEITACIVEISMDVILEGASMMTQTSDATFCNLYTSEGVALTNAVLGGLAKEDNLLKALSLAVFEPGYSLDRVITDFREGNKGVVSFTYNDIQETLSYVPVKGTNWMMTYLIRESVISERISAISSGIIRRSLVQSLLTALVLAAMFAFIIAQNRKNTKLRIEKETADAENRVKHQEMERQLMLQEELLAQKARQEQQERMIKALASDYRSVYYLELDNDHGVCYQARTDLPGFHEGESFNYLESVTAYCNHYILEPYREKFLQFVQPDAIREGLRENQVISYRYMICVDGRETYEMVRFAGVRHPEERDDHIVHNVGACFTDVDAETRESLAQHQVLTDALHMAEQANKAKTVFLSNMSHEIRTPMNAIIGLNNIALNEPDLSEKVHDYLVKISASAQHLLGIINDILDMSRIESGRMVVKNEEFSFAKSLEQVNTIISGQCRDKGLHYDCRTIGKIDDYYIGDEMKIKQIMINILGNAVKFTPEGGTVTFLIEEVRRFDRKATLKFTIRDTGIGMSKEYVTHIFEPFTQEDSSSTNRYGSTGLGMPITKSIVELMNGIIDVESEKGVGTTFTVTLTFGESDRKNIGTDLDINPHEMSVLVVDDDPIALEHAEIVLGQVGIQCETAESGAKALEMATTRHARMEDYDLLLIDWRMPEMDGVETTRQIRAVVGPNTPVIILTSYNWDDVIDDAKKAGVDTFVPKPLFVGSVLDQFREAFRKKQKDLQTPRADLKGRRILLAEDVPVNAEIMVMVLQMREMDVEVAENGRIAVDLFNGHPVGYYDAILMDMRMPEMDGLEATKVIRSSDHADAKTIPIIALTANAFDEDVQRSLQAGLNAHLSKPVEPDDLFETLESLIKP